MTKKKNTNIPDYMPISDYSDENNTDTKIETDIVIEKRGVKIDIDENSTLINNIEIADDEEENIEDVIESINKTMEKNTSNYRHEDEIDEKKNNKNTDLLYRVSYMIDEIETNGDKNDKLDNALLQILKILKTDIEKNNNLNQYNLLIKRINSIKLKPFKKKELTSMNIRDTIFYKDNSENIGYEIKNVLDVVEKKKLEHNKQRTKEIKHARKLIMRENIKDRLWFRFKYRI